MFKKNHNYATGDALKIFWGTDLHLDSTVNGQPSADGAVVGYKYFYDTGRRLQEFVDLVNAEKPDLSLISGDMVEYYKQGDYDLFNSIWSQIDVSNQKELTLGNHDITNDASYFDVVNILGYSSETEVAGSKFNKAFSLTNGVTSARVLLVDTNIQPDNTHISTGVGMLQQNAIDWIENEALTCQEDIFLLFSHHSPHMAPLGYFDPDDASAAITMLNSVRSSRRIKIHWFSGHLHATQNTQPYTTYGGDIVGFRGRCMLDHVKGGLNRLLIFPDGTVSYFLKEL